jgi:hypothetical protein
LRSSASKDLRWPLLTSECLPNDPNDQFHTGVAPLLERIAANGYVIVYLTSRPMGLAAPTLALLASVREGTSRLPTGPLLLSPSRTFEALSRELVHKSVHEFKAACLCELAALWPPGNDPLVGNGPLVGGFGNKASDTRAYLAAGVPPSRIFIIDTSSCVRMPAAGSDAAMSAASAAAAAAMTADADSWAIDLANELAAAAIEEAIATAYGPAPTTAPVTRWLLSAKVADGVASALRLFGAAAAESSAATEESSEESSEEISEEIEDGADVGGDGAEGGGADVGGDGIVSTPSAEALSPAPADAPAAALFVASAAPAAAVTADADSWAIDLANELAAAAIEEAIATAYGPAPTTAPVTRWLLSAKVADGVASALRLFGPLSCRSSTPMSGASGDGAGDSSRWSSLDGGTAGGSTRDSDAAGGSSSLTYPMMLAMLPTLFPPRAGGLLSIAPRPWSLDDSEACGALAARSIIRRALLATGDEAAPQGSEPSPPPPVLIEEMD